MANLDDLDYTSVTDMTTDEGIELMRQIRLSRRTPMKKKKKSTTTKQKEVPQPSAAEAAELLRLLGES